jgi:hypothetical protein
LANQTSVPTPSVINSPPMASRDGACVCTRAAQISWPYSISRPKRQPRQLHQGKPGCDLFGYQ